MGLTLHYELRSNLRTTGQVRRVLTQLHSAARDLPFDEVPPLVEYEAAAGEQEDFPAGLFHATKLVDRAGRLAVVPLRKLIAFRVFPGPGSESAEFGLARYGRQPGWSWHAFCKTQYASAPQHGGEANFLRCHLGLVRLLDQAIELGLQVKVTDEGNFWERRDSAELAREVAEWNEMIAGLGGQLKDAGGNNVSGPIFKFSNFEHLEARGQSRRRPR